MAVSSGGCFNFQLCSVFSLLYCVHLVQLSLLECLSISLTWMWWNKQSSTHYLFCFLLLALRHSSLLLLLLSSLSLFSRGSHQTPAVSPISTDLYMATNSIIHGACGWLGHCLIISSLSVGWHFIHVADLVTVQSSHHLAWVDILTMWLTWSMSNHLITSFFLLFSFSHAAFTKHQLFLLFRHAAYTLKEALNGCFSYFYGLSIIHVADLVTV